MKKNYTERLIETGTNNMNISIENREIEPFEDKKMRKTQQTFKYFNAKKLVVVEVLNHIPHVKPA